MIYIIWALINLTFLIVIGFFLYKSVKSKFGGFSAWVAIFLFIGLIGYLSKRDGEIKKNSNKLKTWELVNRDSLEQQLPTDTKIILEKNILHTYNLGINWGILKNSRAPIPISANSWTTGFIVGTMWQPSIIKTNETNIPSTFEYEAIGKVSWSILGIEIYSQSKTWAGIVTSK